MKRYNMNLTAKGLIKKMAAEEINFDTSYQRGYVWTTDQKSLLIHSMLSDFPIPPMFLVKNDDQGFDSLDGKQRSNAIYSYLNGDFQLMDNFPIVYSDEGEEVDLGSFYFDDLPDWAKDRIKDYSLLIYYFDDITEPEVLEMFRRLNNGKALSAVELTRVQAKSIKSFQTMAKHSVIANNVTEKGKTRFADENIAMQAYAFTYMEDPDFGTKVFRPYIQNVEVTETQMSYLNNGMDHLQIAIDWIASQDTEETNKEIKRILKRLKAKTHLVSMIYAASEYFSNESADQSTFNQAIYNFFKGKETTSSMVYNRTIGAGSACAESVQMRKGAVNDWINSIGVDIPQF